MAAKVIIKIFSEDDNEMLRQISVEANITDHLDSTSKLVHDIVMELWDCQSHSVDNKYRYTIKDI
jgi:hypothetical protein